MRITRLLLGVSSNIPGERDRRARTAFVVLGRVVHAHLREIQIDVFGQAVVDMRTAGGDARDHHCLQLDLDVVDRIPAGFAHGELRVRVMGAIATGEHQLGRAAVYVFDNVSLASPVTPGSLRNMSTAISYLSINLFIFS